MHEIIFEVLVPVRCLNETKQSNTNLILTYSITTMGHHSSPRVQSHRSFGFFADVCKAILAIAGPEVESDLRASKDTQFFWRRFC